MGQSRIDHPEKLTTLSTQETQRKKTNRTKNTTQKTNKISCSKMLDSTTHKHAQKATLSHEPSYKQWQVKTNRTSLICENVTDITIRNSERKDT